MYDETEAIIDQTLEMIIIFDSEGNIEDYNQEAQEKLEYSKELYGTSIEKILPQIFTGNESVREIADKNNDVLMSAFAYRENNTCFPVDIKIHCINDIEGTYACMILDRIKQDALEKELVRVKEEALAATKVQNEFTANVTHELRTPVNGILGHVQILLDENPDSSIRDTLDIIERCCDNMNKIINNILDFSKLSAGKFTIEEREFNVHEMVKHVSDTSSARIYEKGLGFSVHIADNVPEKLIGDELRITQVLNNLISNAVKFTSTGHIGVEVTKTYSNAEEVELFFMVIDTGIGIDEKDIDKLFKDFSQVDASITRKFGGTGLGLSVSKQLVELMKGNISVQSEKGKGSNFSFSVRLKKLEADVGTEDFTEEYTLPNMDMSEQWQYQEVDVEKEIASAMEKLILCIEMETWEKAEQFAINIKSIGAKYGDDFRRGALKIEMAVRKGNYDRAMKAFEQLKQLFGEITGGSR